jgi:hypothetical protein
MSRGDIYTAWEQYIWQNAVVNPLSSNSLKGEWRCESVHWLHSKVHIDILYHLYREQTRLYKTVSEVKGWLKNTHHAHKLAFYLPPYPSSLARKGKVQFVYFVNYTMFFEAELTFRIYMKPYIDGHVYPPREGE